MRVIFMGTPDIAVGTLQALAKEHEVVLAVTQPDKPKGRGGKMQYTPVKEAAVSLGIPVCQPKKIREPECVKKLSEYHADVMVVIAFGQILSKELLKVPVYGCINIHASLLPKYRGAAPIQWAVINGDKETGITTMLMDEGMDTGDMLERRVIALEEKETGGSLFERLSLLGGELILSTLEKLENKTLQRTPQNHDEATYVKKIPKSMGEIDWTKDAAAIERLIRGLNPWPSAYTWLNGKMLKLWEADVLWDECPAEKESSGETLLSGEKEGCGVIRSASDSGLQVQTGKGILNITSLQLEGKRRMDTAAFLRGFSVSAGTRLERS